MTPWEKFFREKITKIFTEKKRVIDIGGGLRVSKKKGNRYEDDRSWILPLLSQVEYKILDPVADYDPDIIGDIHNLPFADTSEEALICIAVLEHVEDPLRAAREMHRVLKSGGFCLVYVPFLYYYHAEKGYYKDYWRFTEDALRVMFKDFSTIEIDPVRGAFETWLHLSPLNRFKIVMKFGYFLDKISGKLKSKQVAGYNIFLIK